MVKGEIKERTTKEFDIPLPVLPLTREEFEKERDYQVCNLPKEFADYVRSESWEQGHSAGYDEVINIARNMSYDLKPIIEKYTKRIKGK
jgi:hypothetical protein